MVGSMERLDCRDIGLVWLSVGIVGLGANLQHDVLANSIWEKGYWFAYKIHGVVRVLGFVVLVAKGECHLPQRGRCRPRRQRVLLGVERVQVPRPADIQRGIGSFGCCCRRDCLGLDALLGKLDLHEPVMGLGGLVLLPAQRHALAGSWTVWLPEIRHGWVVVVLTDGLGGLTGGEGGGEPVNQGQIVEKTPSVVGGGRRG